MAQPHSKANVRRARRLGVTLPDPGHAGRTTEWSSEGHDTVFDGHGKSERRISRDVVSETWSVSIGRRTFGSGMSLRDAMALSHFLSKAQNRRAWRALAPKERKVVEASAADVLTDALSRVNGGAVHITS